MKLPKKYLKRNYLIRNAFVVFRIWEIKFVVGD